MSAGRKNIVVEKGSTFLLTLVWKDHNRVPIDLTGYTARMQVRKSYSSAEKLLDLTTEKGCIVLGGVSGTIMINAPADKTSIIHDNIRSGVYDLEVVRGLNVRRLIEGEVDIRPEVTR